MTSHRLRILVPVDFSEHSRRALDQAFAWALRTPSEIHLAHVVDTNAENLTDELGHDFQELLRVATAELHWVVPAGPARSDQERIGELQRHLCAGRPAAEILKLAARLGIDLIIMGTHGRTGVRRLLMGSVAEKVVRHAGCPVLCVKPADTAEDEGPPTWTRILCPVDFSDASRRAMLTAVDLARRLNVELLLLHVYHPLAAATPEGMMVAGPEVLLGIQKAAETQLESWRRDAETLVGPGVKVTAVSVLGASAEEIVRCAREKTAGAIVMGTHGRTGLVHALMGSVAERVVRTAPCPVLTLHPAQTLAVAERPAGAPE